MTIRALLLTFITVIAQAVPVVPVSASVDENRTSCCAPRRCECCAFTGGKKQSAPVQPATQSDSAFKVMPPMSSAITRQAWVAADTTRRAWSLQGDAAGSARIALTVLHCAFLI